MGQDPGKSFFDAGKSFSGAEKGFHDFKKGLLTLKRLPRFQEKDTPLMVAASHGQLACVELLIGLRANVHGTCMPLPHPPLECWNINEGLG